MGVPGGQVPLMAALAITMPEKSRPGMLIVGLETLKRLRSALAASLGFMPLACSFMRPVPAGRGGCGVGMPTRFKCYGYGFVGASFVVEVSWVGAEIRAFIWGGIVDY
jgi:hypothetical protein